MKYASIAIFTVLLGRAGMATPPQNGCGTRFTSWCVSKYITSRVIPDHDQDQMNRSMNVDGHDATLTFAKACSTGSFRGFNVSRELSTGASRGANERGLGWASYSGECLIHLERGALNDAEYKDLARNVRYYLISLNADGTLKTFSF